jgi:hypothetical protein
MSAANITKLDAILTTDHGWTKVWTGKNLRIDLTPENVRRRYRSMSMARKVEQMRADRIRATRVTDDTLWRVTR